MNKRSGFFNQFSRLATVALVVTLVLAVLDFRDRAKMNQIFKAQQELLDLKKELTQTGKALLQARLNESQLINTQKSVFFEEFEQAINAVETSTRDLTEQIQSEQASEPLATTLIHVDKYRDAVLKTRALQQKMGLGDTEGILRQLQSSTQNIATYLTEAGEQELVFEFAHMQIYERDFSSTLDMSLADQLRTQIDELNASVQAADLPPNLQTPLLNELSTYKNLVSEFINSTVELELSIAASALHYSRISPELSISQEEIDQMLAETAEQLRSQRQVSTFQTITVFSGAFAILLLLVILQLQSARQLAKRLQQLANGMKEVAAGHFEELGELPKGNDDVGTLAETFAAMAQQIRDQITMIRKAQKKAEIASEAKSNFLANMSHELRTPLNAILGFTQVMQSQPSLTAEQHNNLSIINQSGEHLLALINDVLDMSKIEAGKFTLNEDAFDLHVLLETLVSMLRFKADAKGITLVSKCAPTVPQVVKTDEQKLRQVLINLLGNALKFTEVGQVVLQVETTAQSLSQPHETQALRFIVTDSGPGMAPNELRQLFKSFSQGKQGQVKGGTGLGLAISKGFIELMGGEIRVQSQLGRGSQFSFDIQVGLAAPQAAKPVSTQPPAVIGLAPHQSDYRILVVENNAASRLLMVKLLTGVGFRVKEAANGAEAVALCQQWYPHLIWMDLNMPVMNGVDATRQIKQWAVGQSQTRWTPSMLGARPSVAESAQVLEAGFESPTSAAIRSDQSRDLLDSASSGQAAGQGVRLPVVIGLTANAFETDRQAMLAAGCSDFVRKPIQRSLILQKMADYLGACYIYENDSTHRPAPQETATLAMGDVGATSHPILTPKLLSTMPIAWVQRLHQYACLAEQDQIEPLVNDILNAHPTLAQAIQDLIKQFDYEKIITCTEQVLAHE